MGYRRSAPHFYVAGLQKPIFFRADHAVMSVRQCRKSAEIFSVGEVVACDLSRIFLPPASETHRRKTPFFLAPAGEKKRYRSRLKKLSEKER